MKLSLVGWKRRYTREFRRWSASDPACFAAPAYPVDESLTLACLANDQLVARVLLGTDRCYPDRAWVGLVVDPDVRRRGIGSYCLFALAHQFRACYTSFRLYVMDANKPARGLYRKCGYTTVRSFVHGNRVIHEMECALW